MKSMTTCTGVLLLAALLAGSPARAQESHPSPLESRVSLAYENVQPKPVFEAMAQALGCQLKFDDRITRLVTVEVQRVRAETAIKAICESIGCTWRLSAGVLIVDSAPGVGAQAPCDGQLGCVDLDQVLPMRIQWHDARAGAVLDMLAKVLGLELSVFDDVASARVNLTLDKATVRTALDAVCQQIRCSWGLGYVDGRRILRAASTLDGPSPEPEFAPGIARLKDKAIKPPRVVKEAKPNLPKGVATFELQVTVNVECVVKADGTVGEARAIRRSFIQDAYVDEALKAAKQWVFEPGTRHGKPVPVVVEVEFTFAQRRR
jgi:TonB family protein